MKIETENFLFLSNAKAVNKWVKTEPDAFTAMEQTKQWNKFYILCYLTKLEQGEKRWQGGIRYQCGRQTVWKYGL